MSDQNKGSAVSTADHQIARNAVVWLLSTPYRTEGSINDPRESEESGIRFNEKWTYYDLDDDPSGARTRVVYWLRYDFAGTMIRLDEKGGWQPDNSLIEALKPGPQPFSSDRRSQEELELGGKELNDRTYRVRAINPLIIPSNDYRPVSDFEGKPDLGGYIEGQSL